jgi:hypothetical protein
VSNWALVHDNIFLYPCPYPAIVLVVEPVIYIEVASKVLQFGPGKVYGKVEHVVHIYIGRYNLLGCKI